MGNYSSKLFNNNIFNELKVKENSHLVQKLHTTSEPHPQNGEKADVPSENDGIVQTPIKKNGTFEARKRTNAIPDYLQTDKTRKPYLETDLDSVSTAGKFCLDPRSPNVEYPRTPILLQNFSSVPTKNIDEESLFKFNLQPVEAQSNPMDLDPRSPAIEFDRTPISAIKISKQFHPQCPDNMNRLKKSSSSLDICIKLSYCETTSLFNIPEIQALPDIVVSLRRSCSLKENLNEKNSSLTNGDVHLDSELISDDVKSVKLHVSKESSIPNEQEEIVSAKHANTENDETEMKEHYAKEISTNVVSQNPDPPKNIENVHKTSDPEEKFKVWRDSYTKLPEYSGNLNNSQRNSSLPDKEEILIEFDDCSVMNNMRSNPMKKMEKTEESVKEKKAKCVDKKYVEIKKENKLEHENKLFSPEFKTAPELSKIRTPFSNRSNNNGLIQSLSSKSPQQFLGHRKLFISENKNLQENTPPTHKKRVKNIPTKLNSTQWDSDSTIII